MRRFIGEWGFAGLKVDGQHMNAVAPCYNPAHHHARPEESVEKLQDLLRAMYTTALAIDPKAVMELVPVRDVLLLLQFRLHESGPRLGPGVLLAGAP